jgi:hypothetical protein
VTFESRVISHMDHWMKKSKKQPAFSHPETSTTYSAALRRSDSLKSLDTFDTLLSCFVFGRQQQQLKDTLFFLAHNTQLVIVVSTRYLALKMDDENKLKLPPIVGDDAKSTDSSLTHSFYSSSLYSMINHEDMSNDDLLHRLSIKSSCRDDSSASAMVTRELIMASYRHKMKNLEYDLTDDDDNIRSLLDMAKRLELDMDITTSELSSHQDECDTSEFSSHQDETKQSKIYMSKQPDPPEGDESESGKTTLQRDSKNNQINTKSPHFSNGDRYRRVNTGEHPQMRAQHGTRVDSKQQYIRRMTDPLCYNVERENYNPKSNLIGTTRNVNRTSANDSATDFDFDSNLVALARKMSQSEIEDTSSIEGPNDEEYWAKARGRRSINKLKGSGRAVRTSHNSRTIRNGGRQSRDSKDRSHGGSSGANRAGSRHSSSIKEAHYVNTDERKQQTGMKKSHLQFVSEKTDLKHGDSSLAKSSKIRRQKGTNSRSNSRSKREHSLSSNESRQSSRKSVNSRYSSSSRSQVHKRTSKLTVAEAVDYLNKKSRPKSPSQSSLKSHNSKKSSASKMSSTSRTSRKPQKSFVSRESNDVKNTGVSKVLSAAFRLKEKVKQRFVISEKTNDHGGDYSEDESSCFSSSI